MAVHAMTLPLFPHQETAAARLAQGVPTYLGFDMGIGKSRTFIEAVNRRDGVRRVLILCPSTALHVWRSELTKWALGASFSVATTVQELAANSRFIIVTHGMLSQRGGALAASLPHVRPFDMTALDEAHAFNAANSLRVKALQAARANLGLIVPLSGTPMKNHAGELYTLLALCWPQGLKAMQRNQFEEQFCRIANRYFGRAMPVRVIEGSKNILQLRRLMAPFMLRVRKEEVLKDLPPIIWDRVPVPVDGTVLTLDGAHTAEHRALLEQLANADGDTLLAILSGVRSSAPLMTLRRILGLAKLRGALEYIVDMLETLPEDRKLLVFAIHVDVIAALKTHLGEYNPAIITGSTTKKDRAIAVDKFLSERSCRVFIGNLQAAGTALTLVGPNCKCSDVVFIESAWTPADNAQAACRVHRIGQHDGVVVRMLSAAGTIDDIISDLLVRKARDFSQLFDTTPSK